MRVTILGSGTSHGIPVVGCGCEVCHSKNPKDKRTRSSILIEQDGTNILVDTSTDFRAQALRKGIDHLDAILMTHAHADHLHGFDDTRSLAWERPIPLYASAETLDEIVKRFDYAFKVTQIGGGKPRVNLHRLDGTTVTIAGLEVRPIPIKHGILDIYGFRFGDFAYLTDCSEIPGPSLELLEGIKLLVIGALRYRPHATHFSIEEAIAASRKIGPERVWLTHLCHDVSHAKLEEELERDFSASPAVQPAFDGLEIEVERAELRL